MATAKTATPETTPEVVDAGTAHLATKMAQVAAAVERVPKNGWNDHHKYEYALAADVLDAARKELSSRNVATTVEIVGSPSEWLTWQAGKQKVLTVPMRGSFICGDTGASISVDFAGSGADAGDKAIYKAITGGTKYLILSTFLVSTGDDPEGDSRTDREVEQPASPERESAPRIPRDRASAIVAAAKQAGVDETTFKAQLADVVGHTKVTQLTVDEAESIEAWIAEAGS